MVSWWVGCVCCRGIWISWRLCPRNSRPRLWGLKRLPNPLRPPGFTFFTALFWLFEFFGLLILNGVCGLSLFNGEVLIFGHVQCMCSSFKLVVENFHLYDFSMFILFRNQIPYDLFFMRKCGNNIYFLGYLGCHCNNVTQLVQFDGPSYFLKKWLTEIED